MPQRNDRSPLWLLSGAFLFLVAMGCGGTASGIVCAITATLGLRGTLLTTLAVETFAVVSTAVTILVWQSIARIAREGRTNVIPLRWVVAGIFSLWPAGSVGWWWCIVIVVEKATGSLEVRDAMHWAIAFPVWFLLVPYTLGVPIVLARIRHRSKRASSQIPIADRIGQRG